MISVVVAKIALIVITTLPLSNLKINYTQSNILKEAKLYTKRKIVDARDWHELQVKKEPVKTYIEEVVPTENPGDTQEEKTNEQEETKDEEVEEPKEEQGNTQEETPTESEEPNDEEGIESPKEIDNMQEEKTNEQEETKGEEVEEPKEEQGNTQEETPTESEEPNDEEGIESPKEIDNMQEEKTNEQEETKGEEVAESKEEQGNTQGESPIESEEPKNPVVPPVEEPLKEEEVTKREVTSDWKLTEDVYIKGDLHLLNGIVNLEGHTLHVEGSVYHSGGQLKISDGNLRIEGDYLLKGVDGKTSEGQLIMKHRSGIMEVGRDVYIDTQATQTDQMKAGTLIIKGDFIQCTSLLGSYTKRNDFILVLAGEDNQCISVSCPDKINRIEWLVIEGDAERELHFDTNQIVSVQNLKAVVTPKIRDGKNLKIIENVLLENGIWQGDLRIDNIALHKPVVIQGDLIADTSVTLVNKQIEVKENYIQRVGILTCIDTYLKIGENLIIEPNATLSMEGSKSRLEVEGNLEIKTGYEKAGRMKQGTLVIGGSVYKEGKRCSFYTESELLVILKGSENQLAYITGNNIQLEKLQLLQPIEQYQFDLDVKYKLEN